MDQFIASGGSLNFRLLRLCEIRGRLTRTSGEYLGAAGVPFTLLSGFDVFITLFW